MTNARILFISGSLGLGHVTRDIAIAREIRLQHPKVEILWLAAHPASLFLQNAGETVLPDAAPTSYQLGQNYPNPYNLVTTISYALPSPQFVTPKVYDNLGREVATLLSDRKQAGYHQVSFDGKDLLTGGNYYCILAGALTETKYFIIVK